MIGAQDSKDTIMLKNHSVASIPYVLAFSHL